MRQRFPAADHHAGGHRHRLWRDRCHRPDRRDATDRLHLDIPLRVHHPGTLRDDEPGPIRGDALHGQPRHLDGGTVPDRRIPGVPQGNSADHRLRRCAEVAPVLAGTFLVAGLGHVVATRLRAVHQRVPGPDRNFHALPRLGGFLGVGSGALCDLHPVDLSADDDRSGERGQRPPARPSPPGTRSSWPRSSRSCWSSGCIRSPLWTSSAPR